MPQLFMKFYFVKISCPRNDDEYKFGSIVENLINKTKFDEKLSNIPYRLDDAEEGELFFLQIGGDSNNKRKYFDDKPNLQNFDNGIYGIGRINNLRPDEKELDATFYGFDKPVTKKDLYFFPQFIDSLGASTKGIPNQAGLYEIKPGEAKSFIDYLKITDTIGIADQILKDIDSNGYLEDLGKKMLEGDNELYSEAASNFLREVSVKNDKQPSSFQSSKNAVDFELKTALKTLKESGLIYSDDVIARFIVSLITKPFVILSGLSGSGKTQLALSFVNWICGTSSRYELLKKALEKDSIKDRYEIAGLTKNTIDLINKNGTGTIAPLPLELVFEWYDSILDGTIDTNDDPKEVRHQIGDKSQYQKHMHGFYNDLSRLAFAMHDVSENIDLSASDQYKVVPVGADWTNREPLLGYPNALAKNEYVQPDSGALELIIDAIKNPDRPYFLILDEMNMSHVERYFADFLSAIESGEVIQLHSGEKAWNGIPQSIEVPENLFVIGTVNIDETTYMFSPKVLDRANVIEFRVKAEEMERFLENPKSIDLSVIKGKGSNMGKSFVNISTTKNDDFDGKNQLNKELMKFFTELKKTGTEFGYRSAFEINRFASISNQLVEKWDTELIIDIAVMQKLLPKLHGSRRKLEGVLIKLGNLCLYEKNAEELFKQKADIDYDDVKYPISFEKLKRMYKGLIQNGFTSFAEA